MTLSDCTNWCYQKDQTDLAVGNDGGSRCCDYEGWTSGLADCILYGSGDFTQYQNEGAYGDTRYNFFAGFTFSTGNYSGYSPSRNTTDSNSTRFYSAGGVCVNNDSTVDSENDSCTTWYDSNPSGCGNYDDDDFTAGVACCACGGGIKSAQSANEQAACINDDTDADFNEGTCTTYYD